MGVGLRRPPEPDEDLDRLAKAVIDAAIEVHRSLGPGFGEAVYEQALAIELKSRGVPFIRQVVIEVGYKGEKVGEGRIDMIVDGRLILELKAIETLLPIHQAQLLSYLKMKGLRLGLLINFNVELLKQGIKRIINPRFKIQGDANKM